METSVTLLLTSLPNNQPLKSFYKSSGTYQDKKGTAWYILPIDVATILQLSQKVEIIKNTIEQTKIHCKGSYQILLNSKPTTKTSF